MKKKIKLASSLLTAPLPYQLESNLWSSDGKRPPGSDDRLVEFYPAALAVLRNATDWIQESMDDTDLMVDDMERLFFSPVSSHGSAPFLAPGPSAEARAAAVVMFKQNWKSVKLRHHRLAKLLLVRIARKREELQAAKDNASYPPQPSMLRETTYLVTFCADNQGFST